MLKKAEKIFNPIGQDVKEKTMDPNATLAFIEDIANEDPTDKTLSWVLQDLKEWVENGGFSPNWSKFPFGTDLFNQYVEKR